MGDGAYKDIRVIERTSSYCLDGYVLHCICINILYFFDRNIYSATFMPMMIVPLAVG